MTLPKETQERIRADAERQIGEQNNVLALNETYMEGFEEGYIAGATAENERAQKLVETLEKILLQHTYYDVIELAANALQQWSAGKEVAG